MDIKKLIKVIKDSVKKDYLTVWGKQKDGNYFLTNGLICVNNLELTPAQVGNLIAIFGEIPQEGQEIVFNTRGEKGVNKDGKYMLLFLEKHGGKIAPLVNDTNLIYMHEDTYLNIFEQEGNYFFMNNIYYNIIKGVSENITVKLTNPVFYIKIRKVDIFISKYNYQGICEYLKK